ncbi:right-handed parallel beta-helix repeat-containing protein [Zunongwangia endophytica]|uniref:Right-handed parallel beta-helix repeat-containing protein n=1 Tax=Zunongwangia endophytica TaxID=1808945 RepID=A0ABV8H9K0_9FLAO|nr:right-handed parallel beta-helix repeat-containing protein [Zunongwangia endophytica]MDN3594880.1 right-handed parallel beta-helix repeat-containing protein [Zunongwangia endophytica]
MKLLLKKFKYCFFFIVTIFASCSSSDDNSTEEPDPVLPETPVTSNAIKVSNAEDLRDALLDAVAGDSILVAPGTYEFGTSLKIAASGLQNDSIVVMAESDRPIIDFSAMQENSANRGWIIDQDYWKIIGFKIQGAGDNGMFISGSNNHIEFCDFLRNKDSGLQIDNGGANNLILNCDSYFNADSTIENADGFACKLTAGTGNKFEGCRAWNNLDDGWDGYLRNNDNITTTYINCWAINNGYLEDGTPGLGDGNGFKTGGSDTKDLKHHATYIRCLAVGNIYDGFDHNSNRGTLTLFNCSAYNNGRDYAFGSTNPLEKLIIKNSISLNGTNSFKASSVEMMNNSWMDGFAVSEDDFESLLVDELTAARQADGSLPEVSFMNLVSGSDLIDAGVEIESVEFNGTAPDLGAFEY